MDANKTVAQFKAQLNKNGSDIDAAIALGNIYYDNNEVAQAILYYRCALDINPDLPGVRTDMGTMYWRNDDISFAEKAFRDAIASDVGFGNAYVNLGLLLQHARNDIAGARAVWQKLLEVNPNHQAAGKVRELLQETATAIN